MTKVGEILKKDRISKNLNIETISNELKISKELLIKIENDEIKQDVNAVYYIGHVKSYSNYLELNTSEIIQIFKNQISFNKDLSTESISKPFTINNDFKFQKLFASTLIFAIFFAFYFIFIDSNKYDAEYALIPDLPENYIPVIEEIDLNSYKKSENVDQDIKKIIEPNSSSAVASNKVDTLGEEINVTLKLLNPTWVQIRDSSDKIILSKLMEKNEEYSYKLSLNYNITAGNAGNILVLIDNNVRGKVGKYGEILDSFVLDNSFNNQ